MSRGVAQLAQRGQVGLGVDLFAERFGDRAVHGLDRPPPEMSTCSSVPSSPGPHEHVLAVGGQRRVLDQLAAAVDPHVVVGVRLVGLQQRELRVVAEVHALVAEGPAQLEHPLHAADAQPLEVQLRGDAQVQVEVVGVDVGDERTCVGAAVDLLQDRGLDLQKALADQCFADRVQHAAAGRDQVARLGVDGQVDVAGRAPAPPGRSAPSTCPAAGAGTCRSAASCARSASGCPTC